MNLKNFILTATAQTDSVNLQEADLRIRVAGSEVDDTDVTVTNGNIVVNNLSEDIPTAGVEVEVILKAEKGEALYKYTLTDVNGSNPGTKFSKKVLVSVASIKAQENISNSTTVFTFAVDKDSSSTAIQNLVLYTKLSDGTYEALNADALSTVEEGTTLEITNGDKVRFVDAIAW
jgi:hypothetical protein